MIVQGFSRKLLLQMTLAASLGALALAYGAQYGFGLAPCELCLKQRIPYALIAALALIGLADTRRRLAYLGFITALFACETGLASYHVMVERHLVQGPESCVSAPSPAGGTLEDLLHRIQSAPVVACDQPAWSFHGVTMAGMNAAFAASLALFTLYGTIRSTRKRYAPLAR
jgi:disulfide bond formation protein DsbB